MIKSIIMETINEYAVSASDQSNTRMAKTEILMALGISSVILFDSNLKINTHQGHTSITDRNTVPGRWRAFKKDHPIEDVKALFDNIRVIVFYEWVSIANASDLWDGFLYEVIKPLAGKNRSFIFQMGDATRSKIFDVDEILDIMSDYSLYGHVSLVLDENEAAGLYRLLHGMPWLASGTKQGWMTSPDNYFSIYQTMHVDQILICLAENVLAYRKDRQIELPGTVRANKEAVVQFAINDER